MAAGKVKITLCQGATQDEEFDIYDDAGLRRDLYTPARPVRMTVRAPNVSSDAVLTLVEGSPLAGGSVVERVANSEVAAEAISAFDGTANTIAISGGAWRATVVTGGVDDSGNPVAPSQSLMDLVMPQDIARVAGSASNDGNYYVVSLDDANTITVLGTLATEAPGGATVEILRYGRVIVKFRPADTAALSFETGVYDIEGEAAADDIDRLVQGSIKLDLEVTR